MPAEPKDSLSYEARLTSGHVRKVVNIQSISIGPAQEGFVAGYWVANEDGTWVSFSVWSNMEAHERGGQRANATPLLPGQDPAKIPAPTTVVL